MPTDRGVTFSFAPPTRGQGAAGSRIGGRRFDQQRETIARLFELLNQVAEWCFARSDRVGKCYVEYAPDGLTIHVIGTAEAFDFDLNSELAELSVSLSRLGIPLQACLVPACAPVPDDGLKPNQPVFQLNLN